MRPGVRGRWQHRGADRGKTNAASDVKHTAIHTGRTACGSHHRETGVTAHPLTARPHRVWKDGGAAMKKKVRRRWVGVHSLRCEPETLDDVFGFLKRAGWWGRGRPTREALEGRYCRERRGRVEWDRAAYMAVRGVFLRADREFDQRWEARRRGRARPPAAPKTRDDATDAELMLRRAAAGLRG